MWIHLIFIWVKQKYFFFIKKFHLILIYLVSRFEDNGGLLIFLNCLLNWLFLDGLISWNLDICKKVLKSNKLYFVFFCLPSPRGIKGVWQNKILLNFPKSREVTGKSCRYNIRWRFSYPWMRDQVTLSAPAAVTKRNLRELTSVSICGCQLRYTETGLTISHWK